MGRYINFFQQILVSRNQDCCLLRSTHQLRSTQQLWHRKGLGCKLTEVLFRDLAKTLPSNLLAHIRYLIIVRQFLILAEGAHRIVTGHLTCRLCTGRVWFAVPDTVGITTRTLALALAAIELTEGGTTNCFTFGAVAVFTLRRTHYGTLWVLAHPLTSGQADLLAGRHTLGCLALRCAQGVAA